MLAKFMNWHDSTKGSWNVRPAIAFLILVGHLLSTVGLIFFFIWLNFSEWVIYVTMLPYFGIGQLYLTTKFGLEPSGWGGGD